MSKLYASLRLHSLEKQATRIYKCCLAHLPPEAQNDLAVILLMKTCNGAASSASKRFCCASR